MYRVTLTTSLAAIAALTLCQDLRVCCSATANPESGFQPKFLMTQGSNADAGEFPWMVSIQKLFMRGPGHICGGSVITSRWILTAAHCIVDRPHYFIVIFGEISPGLMIMNQPHRVRSMVCTEGRNHPYYDPINVFNDIGLLHTPEKIPFDDYVQPVRLAGYNYMYETYENMDGLVVGWGLEGDWTGGQTATQLKFGYQRIISMSECRSYGMAVDNSIVCASGETPVVACKGDSGSPLLIQDRYGFIQIGVTSSTALSTCEHSYPRRFTRVASFINDIHAITSIPF